MSENFGTNEWEKREKELVETINEKPRVARLEFVRQEPDRTRYKLVMVEACLSGKAKEMADGFSKIHTIIQIPEDAHEIETDDGKIAYPIEISPAFENNYYEDD